MKRGSDVLNFVFHPECTVFLSMIPASVSDRDVMNLMSQLDNVHPVSCSLFKQTYRSDFRIEDGAQFLHGFLELQTFVECASLCRKGMEGPGITIRGTRIGVSPSVPEQRAYMFKEYPLEVSGPEGGLWSQPFRWEEDVPKYEETKGNRPPSNFSSRSHKRRKPPVPIKPIRDVLSSNYSVAKNELMRRINLPREMMDPMTTAFGVLEYTANDPYVKIIQEVNRMPRRNLAFILKEFRTFQKINHKLAQQLLYDNPNLAYALNYAHFLMRPVGPDSTSGAVTNHELKAFEESGGADPYL